MTGLEAHSDSVPSVHILIATDADWVVNEVTAALGDEHTSFTVCREGRLVSELVSHGNIDVVIADLQIGSMGGMAVAMDLRLDASAGAVPETPVVMLLDRVADVFLAQRSGAEAWLVKPLDALRLRKAVAAAANGESYTEGRVVAVDIAEAVDESVDSGADAGTEPEPETIDAG